MVLNQKKDCISALEMKTIILKLKIRQQIYTWNFVKIHTSH